MNGAKRFAVFSVPNPFHATGTTPLPITIQGSNFHLFIRTEVFVGLRPTEGDENVLKGTGFRVCVRTRV